jgi:branched-chain amino acid transport system ATP-binding protein
VLSGGERRLLEISRALVMDPQVLLVDEPSIGLEPRYINMVFEILAELREREGKTIVMVEQNAKKGLAFADIGYVLVAGQLAMAGPSRELLEDPAVARLFLGG